MSEPTIKERLNYIRENLEAIEQEFDDNSWTRPDRLLKTREDYDYLSGLRGFPTIHELSTLEASLTELIRLYLQRD